MKKIGLVITDGVGYRNFILSDFLEQTLNNFDEVIIFSCIPKKVYPKLDKKVVVIELQVFSEKFLTWFFKKSKEISHLRMFAKNNFGIRDNLKYNYPKTFSSRGIATRLIFAFTYFFSSEKLIHKLNKLQQLTFKKNKILLNYIDLLNKNNIDFLFFTHQRPSFIAPLIYASKISKVKTGTFIFSWDNLASKGRMAGDFDYYFVWNDLMKKELLYFYKSINKNKVFIVGTPQFVPYSMSNIGYNRECFSKKFSIDINYPTILFTCNDSSSKNDPIYLRVLANAIKNNLLEKKVNLIVRTSPAEDSVRFKKIKDDFKFIKWNFPKWELSRSNHHEQWTQRIPTIEDVNDLKSILKYSDLVINVLSTTTLDSFVFDTPVINPVFGNKENKMFDDQKFLKYLHLKRLVESNSSIIVKNEKEYIESINYILLSKDDKLEERKAFLKLQTLLPLKNTSKRFVKAFHSISKELNSE